MNIWVIKTLEYVGAHGNVKEITAALNEDKVEEDDCEGF